MTSPRRALGRVVVLNWSAEAMPLVSTLLTGFGSGPERITCLGSLSSAQAAPYLSDPRVRYVPGSVARSDFVDALRTAGVSEARSVIVLPDVATSEPDASSRLTCLAVRQACGDDPVPRMFVEIRDPDARAEFADIGVSSVFLPGFLRASLLTQACVDLSTFDFLLGLLLDSHQLRVVPTPEAFRGVTFGEAAREAEILPDGTPVLLLGFHAAGIANPLNLNPGPTEPLVLATELVVLCERWFDADEFSQAGSADALLLAEWTP